MVDSTLRLLPLEGTNRIWNKKKRLLRMPGHSISPRHPAVALNPGEGWQSKAARCCSAARSGFTNCLSRKAFPEMLRKEVLLAIPAADGQVSPQDTTSTSSTPNSCGRNWWPVIKWNCFLKTLQVSEIWQSAIPGKVRIGPPLPPLHLIFLLSAPVLTQSWG